MLSGAIPPTTAIKASGGNTARSAAIAFGGAISAGKNLRAEAPSSNALNASEGVITPGHQNSPLALAARPTSGFILGDTIIRPLPPATAFTCAGVITVPAPIKALSACCSAILAIDINGSGEFNGTSMILNPASTSISATAKAFLPRARVRLRSTGFQKTRQQNPSFDQPCCAGNQEMPFGNDVIRCAATLKSSRIKRGLISI